MISKIAVFGSLAALMMSGFTSAYGSYPPTSVPSPSGDWQNPGPPFNCKTDPYCNQDSCHANGCDQCLNGYFKKDYSSPCESCSKFTHCKSCQDFAGCGTCEEGFYNEYPMDHYKGGCKPCDEYGVKVGACPNKGYPPTPTYPSPTYQPSPSPYVPSPTPPTYSPPTYSPPTYSPPTYSPPTYSPPTYSPPTYSPPTYSPSTPSPYSPYVPSPSPSPSPSYPPYSCKQDQYCIPTTCHDNGCDQCKDHYFKKDYSSPCESCSQFQNCKSCQDFAGCGTCEEGYYNEYPKGPFKGGCKKCDAYGVQVGACPNTGKY